MNFRKRLMSLGLCGVLMFSSISFADSISVEYVDLLVDSMSRKTGNELEDAKESMSIAFATEGTLNFVKETYEYSLNEDQKKRLKELNITSDQVKRNFEALKTWSPEDRTKLIDLAITADKEGIVELNAKYAKTNSGDSNSSAGTSVDKQKNIVVVKAGIRSKYIEIKEKLTYKIFNDTKSHWANEDVLFFATRGIINGREDGNFYPDDKISKAEVIKIVSNVFIEDGKLLESLEHEYKDVSSEAWYYDYVQNLSNLGVLENSEKLNPSSYPQRQEIIDLMVKTLKTSNIPVNEDITELNDDFKDKDKIISKYRESMAIAVDLGIIQGMGGGILSPDTEVTRAEVMTMTKNLYDYIMKHLN